MDGASTKYPLGMDTEWIRRLFSFQFFSISGSLSAPLNQKEFLGHLVYGYASGCECVMWIYKFGDRHLGLGLELGRGRMDGELHIAERWEDD